MDSQTVTVDLLKSLLAETQGAILAAQRENMNAALQGLEERQEARFQKIETTVVEHGGKMALCNKTLEDLQHRVERLEKQPTGLSSSSTTSGGSEEARRNRLTLVVGGFGKDTRRAEILAKIEEMLNGLGLKDMTDTEAFTTSPRASLALLRFEQRRSESYEAAKKRMHTVMARVAKSKTRIAGQERPLWCGVSKTKPERDRAQHCGLVRSIVRHFKPELVSEMDNDYGKGTSWVGTSRVGCAVDKRDDTEGHSFWVVDSKPNQPWVDLSLLSKEMGVKVEVVERFLKEGPN